MPHNDKWDRRKKYYPELSPVPVEERSSSSSSSDSGSLPDLIIEAAPNRHDDPPAFYEGLEHRMLKYYRKLFLGVKSDDDDSSDIEVNRSMCSSFILDDSTRKDTEANEVSVITVKDSTYSNIVEQSIAEKRLNETEDVADTGHISVDSKSSTSKDEESTLIEFRSETESNHSKKTDDDINIEANGNKQSHAYNDDYQGSTNGDKRNKFGALNETEDVADTGHISIDYKSSTSKDEESPKSIEFRSETESNHSKKTDDDINIEANGNKRSHAYNDDYQGSTNGDKRNKFGALNETEDVADTEHISIDSKSSTVLTPWQLKLSRSVFESRKVYGESYKVLEACGEFLRRLSSRFSDVSSQQEPEMERLITDSQLTRTSLDSDVSNQQEPVMERLITDSQITRTSLDCDVSNQQEPEMERLITDSQLTRTSLDSDVSNQQEPVMERLITDSQLTRTSLDYDVSNQQKPEMERLITDSQLTRTSLDSDVSNQQELRLITDSQLTRTSLDSDKTRAMEKVLQYIDNEVELAREARGSGVNKSWHGVEHQTSPAALAFEKQTDADKLENESSDSTEINAIEEPNTSPHDTPQNIANINDEFWSVPPMEVDIEKVKEKSRGSKRRAYSEGDATAKRMKKDAAVQTSLEETKKRGGIKKEGPLRVFRLCCCPDHVCE